MPPAVEILQGLLQYRADALVVAALIGTAGLTCRRYARRRGAAHDVSRPVLLAAVGIALAGGLLAEWTLWASGYPAPAALPAALVARAAILGLGGALAIVLIIVSTHLAVLRRELREHAESRQQLQQAKAAAEEASRAKSDFLVVMGHEIRTPLNAVMGFANLLSETRLDEAQRDYLATITNEGTRLGALINDLLDLTKIEEGRLVLERLPFAPVETTQEVLRLVRARAREKQLELRLENRVEGPLLVAGDPMRFRQVLLNLVDNAVKFTARGAVTISLQWTPAASRGASPGRLAVTVRDTGIGIPEEKLKHLFQKFTQADTSTSRRFGGTGLGLAICHRLVHAMGGDITVRSRRGQGAEFAFTLPLTPVTLPGSPLAGTTGKSATGAVEPRVLVVEETEANRQVIESSLRRHGFTPETVAGGEEMVRLATERGYNAIVLDLQTPDLDGYLAIQQIRASEPPGRRTPVIALTTSTARDTRERCLAAGMDEHLTKPLDPKKFDALLDTLMGPTSGTVALAG